MPRPPFYMDPTPFDIKIEANPTPPSELPEKLQINLNITKQIQLLGKLGYHFETNEGPVEFVSNVAHCPLPTCPDLLFLSLICLVDCPCRLVVTCFDLPSPTARSFRSFPLAARPPVRPPEK